ncbi:CocE/NonD family hydrolase [Sporosarcina sp. Te-1]|uniref:CocE/NonD family hydrolase n=1 Tax=Sporosarcina sp. Te-1 TaxID=2818390 RepID=UPI001A9FE965|nr:CocE/NonD family hydrolase [Sporosarcina sp. Te-1]QTD42754.1 CocE/NonD family hydrolase [Sporosarcina sp. Te-1]
MTIYHLYRSGIHDATIEWKDDLIYISERDVNRNNWNEKRVLNEEDAIRLHSFYHINPIIVFNQLAEFQEKLTTDVQEVRLSNGFLYQRHEGEQDLWVQREQKFPLDILMIDQEPVAFIAPTRENCHVLVKAGYEAFTPVDQWKRDVSPAQYGVKHIGSFRVKMRDGIHLATDVWLPEGADDAVPAIFIRTPYGKLMYEKMYTHFIQRGYGVVIQDTRGRQDSEGKWLPMSKELEDGDDSLNWIASNSWCDGNIGMIGASYGGYVQWAAAASGNPHLKALISIVTAGSAFIDIPRKGGALVSGMLAWAFAMAEQTFKPENMLRSDWNEVVKIRPLQDIPKIALGRDIPFWNEWMEHAHEDDFWGEVNWSLHKKSIQAPAMIVSGWYDDNGMGTTEALEIVSDYKPADKKVILGPWMHDANTTRDIQGVPLGNNALRYDLDYRFQQWFDCKLKGKELQLLDDQAVEYYITGENKWTHASSWPPKEVEWTKLYVAGDGQATVSHENGTLVSSQKVQGDYVEYVYDPNNPAPHLIDISENEIGVPADYQEVEKRDDVLVYSSDPLLEPVTVVGDLVVKLFAWSSARDTDWIVRLTDVDASGRSIKLTDGVLRARYRNGFDHEELLEPGKVEEYTIRTAKLAHTFKKGHRIRFTITSSADQFIFPNHNTGHDPATDTETEIAIQRVYHTKEYPTHIEMPILL